MAITTTMLYKTADGKTFESEIDANAHEVLLAKSAEINTFLTSVGIPANLEGGRGNPRHTQAMNLIAKWLSYTPAPVAQED